MSSTTTWLSPLGAVLGVLLGWVAGEMAVSDPAVTDWMTGHHTVHMLAPAAGAVLVVLVGTWLMRRAAGRTAMVAAAEQTAH